MLEEFTEIVHRVMESTGEDYTCVMYMPMKDILENYYIGENYDELMIAGYEYRDLNNKELEWDQCDYDLAVNCAIKMKLSPLRAIEYVNETDTVDINFKLYEEVDDEY